MKGSEEPTPALSTGGAPNCPADSGTNPSWWTWSANSGSAAWNPIWSHLPSAPRIPAAAEAIREPLGGGAGLPRETVELEGPETAPLLVSLAASGDPRCVPWSAPPSGFGPPRGNANSGGQGVGLVRSGVLPTCWSGSDQVPLPPELAGPATTALKESRWPEIRSAVSATGDGAPGKGWCFRLRIGGDEGDTAREPWCFRRPDGLYRMPPGATEGVDFGPVDRDRRKTGQGCPDRGDPGSQRRISFDSAWRFCVEGRR